MKKARLYFVTLLMATTFHVISTIKNDQSPDEHVGNSILSQERKVFEEIVKSIEGNGDDDVLNTEKLFKNLHLKSCVPLLTPGCNSVSSIIPL